MRSQRAALSRDLRPVQEEGLQIRRATYSVAVRALYQENEVVFTNYGSDLKLLCKAIYRVGTLAISGRLVRKLWPP